MGQVVSYRIEKPRTLKRRPFFFFFFVIAQVSVGDRCRRMNTPFSKFLASIKFSSGNSSISENWRKKIILERCFVYVNILLCIFECILELNHSSLDREGILLLLGGRGRDKLVSNV